MKKKKKKKGSFCLVSMFPSWVVVLKLSKKVHLLQYYADPNKKPKSVKAIHMYASVRSHCIRTENNIVYKGLSHRSWDISDIKLSKKILTQQKFNKVLRLQILISPK